jgi:PAS domain-containing protein
MLANEYIESMEQSESYKTSMQMHDMYKTMGLLIWETDFAGIGMLFFCDRSCVKITGKSNEELLLAVISSDTVERVLAQSPERIQKLFHYTPGGENG